MRRLVIAIVMTLVSFSIQNVQAESGKAQAVKSIMLVLDASGSMNAKLPDGTARIDAAKAAVVGLVGTLNNDTRLALRAYGHQSPTDQKNCNDSELVVGFGIAGANKAAILDKARTIRARGYTPINLSLQLAARDLATEESAERIVLLVSDGKETCEGDPCATAKALADADAKLAVHVVGFGVDSVTREQLQCIARFARGHYFDANNAGDLGRVLNQAAVTKAVQPQTKKIVVTTKKLGRLRLEVEGHSVHEIRNQTGQNVGNLRSVQRIVDLPPGIYSVKFGNGLWTGIEVKAGETTEIKPGYIEVTPLGSGFVYLLDSETGQTVEEILSAKPRATLIPGRFDLKFGEVLWPGGVELHSGQTTTIRPGVISVQATRGIFYFYAKDADGKVVAKGDVPGTTRLALPPGRYTLEIDPDKWIKTLADEQRTLPVELVAGQQVVVEVD